jgi:hypothetical protein
MAAHAFNPRKSGGGGMSILGQPGNIRVRPYPKTKLKRGKTGGVAQVEDHLPGKAEALSSNTRTTK